MASVPIRSLSPAARARYAAQIDSATPQRPAKVTKRANRYQAGESDLEVIFRRQARAAGIAEGMVQEFTFCERGWRLDFAWPARRIALEIDGGVWNGGAHVRGAPYEATCEKLNRALDEGWAVYRATNHMVEDGRALAIVEAALRKGTH